MWKTSEKLYHIQNGDQRKPRALLKQWSDAQKYARTLAESARESDGRSRRGLNFVTIQTKMQSLPGKEVNNFMFDSVLADLFLVTSRRSQIFLCRFRVAGIFSKGDKFLSEWATFDGLSRCRRCLGRRWPRLGKFVHTFFSLLVYPISLLLVPIFFRRGKICAHDCAYLFAFLCLHSLTCQCSFNHK